METRPEVGKGVEMNKASVLAVTVSPQIYHLLCPGSVTRPRHVEEIVSRPGNLEAGQIVVVHALHELRNRCNLRHKSRVVRASAQFLKVPLDGHDSLVSRLSVSVLNIYIVVSDQTCQIVARNQQEAFPHSKLAAGDLSGNARKHFLPLGRLGHERKVTAWLRR